jgi:hypothetical protein
MPQPTHAKPAQTGGTTPGASHTTTRRPNPAANAAEPHDPDPQPRNERRGRTPEGHAPDGSTTNRPRAPGETDRTQAADRKASAPTAPARAKRAAEARNTSREGEPQKNCRTKASTPTAQPTETRHPAPGTEERSADKAATAAADGEREPEKPTEETPESRDATGETGKVNISSKLYITYYSTCTYFNQVTARNAATHGKKPTALLDRLFFLGGYRPKTQRGL